MYDNHGTLQIQLRSQNPIFTISAIPLAVLIQNRPSTPNEGFYDQR